ALPLTQCLFPPCFQLGRHQSVGRISCLVPPSSDLHLVIRLLDLHLSLPLDLGLLRLIHIQRSQSHIYLSGRHRCQEQLGHRGVYGRRTHHLARWTTIGVSRHATVSRCPFLLG